MFVKPEREEPTALGRVVKTEIVRDSFLVFGLGSVEHGAFHTNWRAQGLRSRTEVSFMEKHIFLVVVLRKNNCSSWYKL